jgi:hypothetical protein
VSAVETRTRLEQLHALRRRTAHELDIATSHGETHRAAKLRLLQERVVGEIEAIADTPPTAPRGLPLSRREKADTRTARRLEQLGVTSHQVKAWAVTVGLIDQVRRGRVKGDLVEAYARHHHTQEGAA